MDGSTTAGLEGSGSLVSGLPLVDRPSACALILAFTFLNPREPESQNQNFPDSLAARVLDVNTLQRETHRGR